MFNPNWVITVTTANGANPKVQFGVRNGVVVPLASYQRFAYYIANPGCTVQQYKAWCADPANAHCADKGKAALDLVWDTQHGFIQVAPAIATPAALPAAPDTSTDTAVVVVPADAAPTPAAPQPLTKAQRKALRKVKAA